MLVAEMNATLDGSEALASSGPAPAEETQTTPAAIDGKDSRPVLRMLRMCIGLHVRVTMSFGFARNSRNTTILLECPSYCTQDLECRILLPV